MAECVDKNMIDKDEYPQTAELERRCVHILADLWHAPDPATATGCSTTGSSEACMLAGHGAEAALGARATGGDPTRQPNLVMGANVQVCWEKFCRYWDVEPRIVPMEGDRFHLDAAERRRRRRREHHRRRRHPGLDLRRQLRARRGDRGGAGRPGRATAAPTSRSMSTARPAAMIAPFLDPDLVWDFRLPRVASINTSGHKYGLVYPGVGWVLWRDARRPARRAGLQRQLPRRRHADLRAELLPARRRGRRAVLHLLPARPRRLPRGAAGLPATSRRTWPTQIERCRQFRLITRGDELPVFAFTTADA